MSFWKKERKKIQFLFIFEINMQIRQDPVSNHNMNVVIQDSDRNKPYHHKQSLCLVHGVCSLMLGKWTQMYNTLFPQQLSGEKQERGFTLRNSERKNMETIWSRRQKELTSFASISSAFCEGDVNTFPTRVLAT